MLKFLIDKGKTNVKLQYNSNLSYSKFKKYDIVQLWKKFDKEIVKQLKGENYYDNHKYLLLSM